MVNLCLNIFLHIIVCVDPNPYSEYGSGSTKLLNMDPIWIRIHNTGSNRQLPSLGAIPWYAAEQLKCYALRCMHFIFFYKIKCKKYFQRPFFLKTNENNTKLNFAIKVNNLNILCFPPDHVLYILRTFIIQDYVSTHTNALSVCQILQQQKKYILIVWSAAQIAQ